MSDSSVLLLQPLGYRPGSARRDISRMSSTTAPLGLASLAAYLEGQGIPSSIIDCYANPMRDEDLRAHLAELRPGLVGMGCNTSNFLDGVRIARLAKEALPDVRIVFGGAHVSALCEQVLRDYDDIDYLVVGEGERPLAGLARLVIEGGGEPREIPGLAYRDADGSVRFTGSQGRGLELDSLPFPAYEKLEGFPRVYRLPIFNYPKTPHSGIISSRGCPYECSYCDRSVFGRTFRHNSAEYVYEHLGFLKSRYGIRHVTFYDDQFTLDRGRVDELMRKLIDSPLGMTFNCAVRAEHVDGELLGLMKAAGCWMISLGIETGDEELLARHRQNPDLEMLADKVRLIKSVGIRVKGLLMMGLPGETEASIERSMSYVLSLPLDDLNIAKFTPLPGSPVYENIRDQGEFNEDWSSMDLMNFQFVPSGLSQETLQGCFHRFYKSHFMRPRILFGYAAMTWRSPDSWRRFVSDLGSFLRFARSDRRIAAH